MPPFVPSAAAQAIAALAGDNQANLASPLTALKDSIAAGNLAPAALINAVTAGVGFQASHDVGGNGGGASSMAFVDATYTPMSWTAPIAKRYYVRVDASAAITDFVDHVQFRITIASNGNAAVAVPTTGEVYAYAPATNKVINASWGVPFDFAAGSHIIQLQWRTTLGANVVSGASTRYQVVITG